MEGWENSLSCFLPCKSPAISSWQEVGVTFCGTPQPSPYADVTMLEIRIFPDPSLLSLQYTVLLLLLLAQPASPKAALLLLILFFLFSKQK